MKNFFEGKGFYIVLALCVTAIGAAGYVSFLGDNTDETMSDNSQDEVVSSVVTLPKADDEESVLVLDEESETLKEIPELDTDANSNKEEQTIETEEPNIEPSVIITAPDTTVSSPEIEVSKKSEALFLRPVLDAEVIQEHSQNELVKDVTMNDWRTHNATDYVATAGTHVLAITNGTVTEITTSDQYATVVEIEHADGLVTKTYGLNSDTTVNIGDNVVAGDVIGTAIGTILFEEKIGEHIHVEAFQNGTNIDVETLFE